MINAVALVLLLSYLGSVVVLVPEPHLTRKEYVVQQQDDPEKLGAAQHAVSSLMGTVHSAEKESPSKLEQIKDKVYQGYEKTANGIGHVKESAKDAYERAKHGVQDKSRDAYSSLPGKGAYEKAKHGIQEKSRDAYSSLPSKEEAASYIPGRDQGRDALEALKLKLENSHQSMEEAIRDATASGKDNSVDFLKTLKTKLEESQRGMQESLHDAVSYPGRQSDSEQDFTENVGEMFDGVKERLSTAEEQKNKKLGWFRRKPQGDGGMLTGRVQEFCNWFVDGTFGGKDSGDGGGGQEVSNETKESYRYLVDAAKGSIDAAREVFNIAVSTGEGGGFEWRERYNYLAESAKGAMDGGKEVFERVAAGGRVSRVSSAVDKMKEKASQATKVSAEDKDRTAVVDWTEEQGGRNATTAAKRLKRAAEHTKERLEDTLAALLRTLYLATFSVLYGVTLWMTFVSGHLLALALPRQQLGTLQSKLFPIYLRTVSLGLAICFGVHAFLHPWPSADRPERLQYFNFAVSLAACLFNTFVVEPQATKAMFEKLKVEKEEGTLVQGPLVQGETIELPSKARAESVDAKFKDMHAYTSTLNLVNVAGLSWHLWYLANRLMV